MSTFLFKSTIFGPVKSRRLGISLGINLMPANTKLCNFNCIYCECGFTTHNKAEINKFPTAEQVYFALSTRLKELFEEEQLIDAITFAGNGEPTLHPQFPAVIEKTIMARDNYFPTANIAVLSNASLIDKPEIFYALEKVDLNILKLDPGAEELCRLINQPSYEYSHAKLIPALQKFKGNLIIQSMFFKGTYQNKYIDNTQNEALQPWLENLKKINPKQVMIYTIERDTATEGLEKIPLSELKKIAKEVNTLGIETQIAE